MSATLTMTYRTLNLRACEIEPLDEVTQDGRILVLALRVRRPDAIHTVVDYESCAGEGTRVFDSWEDVTVKRPNLVAH
jgi:hypothetical protein